MLLQQTDRCFAPVVDAGTRVLILGSLPGQRSLSASQYYAHPQNQFWRLIGQVIGRDLPTLSYAERLTALHQHGIGLWDTVAQANRPGSLDSALRDVVANDLVSLIGSLHALQLIAFNGQKAAAIGQRQLAGARTVRTVALPSSSPAYTMPFEEKLALWSAGISAFVG